MTGGAEVGTRSYYGRPVLKAPVWKPLIPLYFFTGGLAGASSTLALAARLAGNPLLARSALVASLAATAASPPLLVADLGRPERFANMLRVAKPTSPMSVGTWVLSAFAPAASAAAICELTDRMPRLGRTCAGVAGALGPVMATYTAVLVADTAIPAWHDARRELPFVFAGSAAASAGAMALVLTPSAHAGPARRLAAAGALIELGATQAMEVRLGELAEPYRNGEAAKLAKAAKGLTAAGAVLALAGRRRSVAVAAGLMLVTGGLLTRFAVFRAGFGSAQSPEATVGPQRRRLEQRAAAGA
ncbi:MAG: NrfD/PsrC family molybdoenzyme membrane anchor subunit [Acidimicrobiales bacterium]